MVVNIVSNGALYFVSKGVNKESVGCKQYCTILWKLCTTIFGQCCTVSLDNVVLTL